MDELKIRNDGVYLNGRKIDALQTFKVKSEAEGYAEVYMKLFVKLG